MAPNFHEYFEYKDNGKLFRIKKTAPKAHNSRIGKEAGTPHSGGYRNVTLFGKRYFTHRVVWYMHNGEFPEGEIDHINGIRDDNRIENLRDVNRSKNMRNQRIRENSKSGVLGVIYDKSNHRWKSQIGNNEGLNEQKYFKNFNDSVAWRKKKEIEYGYHENHGRSKKEMCNVV